MLVFAAKAREAAGVLEVELNGLTSDALSRAYRLKAKDCHPDHHGNEKLALWARVSWAKECLDRWLEDHPPQPEEEPEETLPENACRTCKGKGRVNVRKRGFGAPLTMACVYCRGAGVIEPEENDFD